MHPLNFIYICILNTNHYGLETFEPSATVVKVKYFLILGWFDKQWYVNNAMIYTTRTKLFIFGVGIIWLTLWFATASSLSSSTHLHFWPEKFPPKLRAQRWAACLAWRSMPKVWAKVNWNHTNYHPHMVLVIELGWFTKGPDRTCTL